MKRLLAIAFALFAVSTAQAQQKTTAQIKNDITTLFPTTGAGLITANQLRQVTNEMADSYANKGGDTFNGLLTLPSLALTGAPGTISLGNQSYAAGVSMKQDFLWSDGVFDPKTLGGYWPTSTYAWQVNNRTFTASTVTGQGALYNPIANGPLITQLNVATNNGATAAVVAGLNWCQITGVSGGTCFGGNDVVFLPTGKTGQLVGRELDIEFAAGSTDAGGSIGMPINVFSISSNATAIQIAGVGGGTWGNGLVTSNIRGAHYSPLSGDPTTASSFIDTRNGTFANAAIVLGASAAQGINFGGGSFNTSPFIYADGGGNLYIRGGTASNTQISGTSTTYQLSMCSTDVTFAGCGYIGANSASPFQVQNPVNLGQSLMTVSTGGIVNGLGGLSSNGVTAVDATGGIHLVKKTAAQVLAITCNAGAEGTLYAVTDANSTTFNAAIAAGGANHVMAYCNGTGWTVH